jgi:putative ABC transport system ATP-binding protein
MNSYKTSNVLVRLQNVSKVYHTNDHKIAGVIDINISFARGQLVLLLGPSGSGKTTLLNLIAGLIKPTSGNVYLFDKNIQDYSEGDLQQVRAKNIGFIFQTFLLIDPFTVKENIELVLRFGANGKSGKLRALELLNKLGIGYVLNKYPAELSQGEKQRVAIARAIANNAELILADEPTANLESSQGFEIINILYSYAKRENKCVIVVSHDLRLKNFTDRIICIEDGMIKNEY